MSTMLNIDEIKEFLGCDDAFLFKLMSKFLEESGEGMQRLKSSVNAKDWKMVRAVAHKMLSSTRIFNITELNGTLEAIQDAAETGKGVENIPEKLVILERGWNQTVAEIQKFQHGFKS
jgi:HPt (histidine-containing phosphotransfer) domain-containing protein